MNRTQNHRSTAEKADRWKFGRSDLMLLRFVVLATAIGYPAAALLPRVLDWVNGRPLHWMSINANPGPPVTAAAGPAAGQYTYDVAWTIPGATPLQWWGSLLPTLVTAVLLLAGCVALWRLLTLTRTQDPFSKAGVWLVRVLSLTVLTYAVLLPLLRLLADALVMTPVLGALDVRFGVEVSDLAPFVIGLLMVVAAECFRQGLRLRDDVAGLV